MEVSASAAGIASLGIQICQGLVAYYAGWRDYKTDINSTLDSIADLKKTLTLLKASLDDGELDSERSERVQRCLQSSEESLVKLSKKSQKLRTYGEPQGFRQKTWAELQRSWYPFRASTLMKLRKIVNDVLERLKMALQVLQLDVTTNSQKTMNLVAARTESIEASVAQVFAQNQRLLDAQQSDRFEEIVKWLSPPDPWTNHASARQRHEPQTGKWLLQSDKYQKWKTGPTSHLWLYGKAGCGKTVLCSTVIEDIRLHCESRVDSAYAIFYFSFSDNQKQSYKNLIRSLIAQLGRNAPSMSMLLQAYDKPNRSVLGIDELETILLASLESAGEMFLLFDGLDECPEGGELRQQVLKGLERLSQGATNVSILATSRELLDVRKSMAILGAEEVSVAELAVDADISRYLSTLLSSDRKFGSLDLSTKLLIEKAISEKANGMFRWAYCQIQELKKLKSFKPKYVDKAPMSLPSTLDETYQRMLNGIEDMYREEALTLLQWLAYAKSPLSLNELAEAAIINPTADVVVDVENRGDLEDTLEILAGLVTIERLYDEGEARFASRLNTDGSDAVSTPGGQGSGQDNKIKFAHFSVQEFLESSRILQSGSKAFFLEAAAGHRHLAQSCLTYLMHYSNSTAKTSTTQDLKTFPLLSYAANLWYYHSHKQQSADTHREMCLLSSEKAKQDWLFVHLPDIPMQSLFEDTRPIEGTYYVGTGLYYASLMGLQPVVEGLLTAPGVDINARCGIWGNALQAASRKGQEQVVQLLLDAGANVNTQGSEFWGNALYAASHQGHLRVAQLLRDNGADVNAENGFYGSALQIASFRGHQKIVQLLIDKGARINTRYGIYGNALQLACLGGHMQIVHQLLDNGADVNLQGGHLGNALQAAACVGNVKIVEILLHKGADVNAQGGDYGSAFRAASSRGHGRVVQLLLDNGADPNMFKIKRRWEYLEESATDE